MPIQNEPKRPTRQVPPPKPDDTVPVCGKPKLHDWMVCFSARKYNCSDGRPLMKNAGLLDDAEYKRIFLGCFQCVEDCLLSTCNVSGRIDFMAVVVQGLATCWLQWSRHLTSRLSAGTGMDVRFMAVSNWRQGRRWIRHDSMWWDKLVFLLQEGLDFQAICWIFLVVWGVGLSIVESIVCVPSQNMDKAPRRSTLNWIGLSLSSHWKLQFLDTPQFQTDPHVILYNIVG